MRRWRSTSAASEQGKYRRWFSRDRRPPSSHRPLMTTRSPTTVVGQAEILCTLNRDFCHTSVLEYCTEHGVLVGSDVYFGRASECPANRALSLWRSAGECDYFRSDAA